MSKMDALRAMREAKYAATTTARAPQPTASAPARPARAVTTTAADPSAKKPAAAPAVPVDGDEGLCGHRNMSGRTCTREKGHSAKSHRYGTSATN